jgi:hypothetical protein
MRGGKPTPHNSPDHWDAIIVSTRLRIAIFLFYDEARTVIGLVDRTRVRCVKCVGAVVRARVETL